MDNFTLEIITPHKVTYNKKVDMVILRTTEGDMGILPKHSPLVAELAISEMKVKRDGIEERFFVAGGFLEISKDKTVILADKAIPVDEIDIEKAREEKELYEAKLRKITEDREIAITQRALQEALTKIRILEGR